MTSQARRGMHSACGGYWNTEKVGWKFRPILYSREGTEANFLDFWHVGWDVGL